jgi:hypothetical protein
VERQLLVRRAFLAGLALVYLVAFLSLWVQIDGLIGSQGILPAATGLARTRARLGDARHLSFPTVLWWLGAGDGTLHALCAAGVLLAALLAAGVAPSLTAFLLWLDYLSLYTVSGAFLSFQWDILLLETGALAVLYAPPAAWLPTSRGWAAPPSRAVTWMLRLLLAKLMFSSGVVKLASGDPTWWNLTALAVHYETTCLPTWTGWYVHQFPLWFHKTSAVLMFAGELVLPFLIFGPRRLRLLAAAGFAALMAFIGGTGNYGFFNLQTLVLCVPLLDDDVLPGRWRAFLRRVLPEGSPLAASRPPRGWPAAVTVPVAVVLAVANAVPVGNAFRASIPWPASLLRLYRAQQPFHLVNGYGLFARMSTRRPEIVIEGSDDRRSWRPYEFRWKPSDPRRRPAFVQPHMPRLDWRMWFAALGTAQRERWFYPFCQRLLEGSPAVLALLATNPFPERPPRYLRATLHDYRFTRWGDGETAWWRRRVIGPYTPTLSLSAGERPSLRAVPPAPPGPEAGSFLEDVVYPRERRHHVREPDGRGPEQGHVSDLGGGGAGGARAAHVGVRRALHARADRDPELDELPRGAAERSALGTPLSKRLVAGEDLGIRLSKLDESIGQFLGHGSPPP